MAPRHGLEPQLAAFPGPAAPPIAGRGAFALSQGNSAGESGLRANILLPKLSGALRSNLKPGTGAKEAIEQVAIWVDTSFQEWTRLAQVNGIALQGRGPVPMYAPPYVPVGPVVMGDNLSVPGHVVAITGPRFGKIVL